MKKKTTKQNKSLLSISQNYYGIHGIRIYSTLNFAGWFNVPCFIL